MIIVINYADDRFVSAQKFNTKSAVKYGADKVIEYSKEKLGSDFYINNKSILDEKRGGGYWLWKPYIIEDALSNAAPGDYVLYSDSGAAFVDRIEYLISCMERDKTDIMLFSLDNTERKYTKRDAFVLMGCDNRLYADSLQRLASYGVFRKTPYTERFVDEWLRYSKDRRIITDDPNCMGKPNYDDFVDHRHDQSILSILSKKWGIDAYRDPSQAGLTGRYANVVEKEILLRSTFPQVIDIHRNPNLRHWYQLSYKKWYKWIDINRNPVAVIFRRISRKICRELHRI